MKKLLSILLIACVVGCTQPKNDYTITAKSYRTFWDNPMQPCICRFFYNKQEFHDSCNKYNVGDTIKHQ